MELECVKVVPGGNATVLVTTPVPEAQRARVAAWLMGEEGLGGEQVGFVDLAGGVPRLAMMGGEFCANACRALAVLLAEARRIRPGEEVLVATSGLETPVAVAVHGQGPQWQSWVRVPWAAQAEPVASGTWVVRLPGIVHVLVDEAVAPFDGGACHEVAAAWRRRLGLTDEAAVGCVWFGHGPAALAIRPLVWVRATATAVLETACGSGTLAVMAVLPHLPWDQGVRVLQPSGQALEVRREGDAAWLGGPARCTVRATVPLP